MVAEVIVALAGAVVIGVVDALFIRRVAQAYVRTRKRPHLLVALGIAASYVAVLGSCAVLAAQAVPALAGGAPLAIGRGATALGAAAAYGLVGVFAADTFGGPRAFRVALAGLAALGGLGLVALATEDVATPVTWRWELRVPFVAISLAGSAGGARAAGALACSYGRAKAAGRHVAGTALGRMRAMCAGFAAMAMSQAAILGFEPRGDFLHPVGIALIALVMLGALGFALACVATWATPEWLRRHWEAA